MVGSNQTLLFADRKQPISIYKSLFMIKVVFCIFFSCTIFRYFFQMSVSLKISWQKYSRKKNAKHKNTFLITHGLYHTWEYFDSSKELDSKLGPTYLANILKAFVFNCHEIIKSSNCTSGNAVLTYISSLQMVFFLSFKIFEHVNCHIWDVQFTHFFS